ncbi:uncharacterized protein SAPINGB_P000019 [Magnusiomyces paraingens]|uniref:Peptidase A1 domain-containing protein n=1 Tax=Magnusiomyces paraingens TaxID=2606893 RepID=A0A5E8AWH1_9ASCO|nr:uncharacterized protein SAPINGB_P000019 [Saprochaete ingens]VVT43511.1 unnamed protein product [Saprochaete ingens]
MVLRYGDNSYAAGEFGSDILRIDNSNMKIIDMEFIKAYEANTLGVFGIGMPGLEVSAHKPDNPFEYKNFPIRLQEAGFIDSIAYSMWLNTPTATSGMVVFGGVDMKKFIPPLITIDLVPTFKNKILEFTVPASIINYFEAPCTTPFVLNEDPIVVLVDVGSTSSYLPINVVTGLSIKLNMTQDDDGDYVRPCNYTGDDNKFITIRLANFDLNIPVTHLILPKASLDGVPVLFDNGDPVCYLGVYATDDPKFCSLGDNVLRSAYLVFDLDNKRLAVAQTKTDSLESNILAIRPGINGIPGSIDAYSAPTPPDICKNYTYGNNSVSVSGFSISLPTTTIATNLSTKPLPFMSSNITSVLSKQTNATSRLIPSTLFSTFKQTTNISFFTSNLISQTVISNLTYTTFSTDGKISPFTTIDDSSLHTHNESLANSQYKTDDLLFSTPYLTLNNHTISFPSSVSTLSTSIVHTHTYISSFPLNQSHSTGEMPILPISSTPSLIGGHTKYGTITSSRNFVLMSSDLPFSSISNTSTYDSSFVMSESVTTAHSFISATSFAFSKLSSSTEKSKTMNQTKSFDQNLIEPHTRHETVVSIKPPSVTDLPSKFGNNTIKSLSSTTMFHLSTIDSGGKGSIRSTSSIDSSINFGSKTFGSTSLTRNTNFNKGFSTSKLNSINSISDLNPLISINSETFVHTTLTSNTPSSTTGTKKLGYPSSTVTPIGSKTFKITQKDNFISVLSTNINLISTEINLQISSVFFSFRSKQDLVPETDIFGGLVSITKNTITSENQISSDIETTKNFKTEARNTFSINEINGPLETLFSNNDQSSNVESITYMTLSTPTPSKSFETRYPLTEEIVSNQKTEKDRGQTETYFGSYNDNVLSHIKPSSIFSNVHTYISTSSQSFTGDSASQNPVPFSVYIPAIHDTSDFSSPSFFSHCCYNSQTKQSNDLPNQISLVTTVVEIHNSLDDSYPF